jgi:hypothetical protein
LIHQPENTEAKNIFDVLASEFQWESSLQEYLQVDADVMTEEMLTDGEIIQQVSQFLLENLK